MRYNTKRWENEFNGLFLIMTQWKAKLVLKSVLNTMRRLLLVQIIFNATLWFVMQIQIYTRKVWWLSSKNILEYDDKKASSNNKEKNLGSKITVMAVTLRLTKEKIASTFPSP